MNQSLRVTYLSHSKLLFIPLLGTLLYKIQLCLFKKELLKFIFISRRNNQFRNKLLTKVSQKSRCVLCQSYKFARLLENIKSEIILDISIKNLSALSQNEAYSLMWSLVHSNAVTPRTKNSIKDFISRNFPVQKIIVIPYNDSFEVVCDYIFQTAKVLANEGNIVYLIALVNPVSLLKHLLLMPQEKSKRQEFFDNNNIVVISPLTLFPLRLMKLKVVEKMNRYLSLLHTAAFIKRVNADYLWYFDPADINLTKLIKHSTKTIYDCVDYFSTLDPELDETIKSNEAQLIKKVDYFFTNSNALKKVKQHIRKADAVVPQGFDIEAFETKNPPSPKEKKEILSVKRLSKSIPHPRVGFVGNLTYRLNFKLLRSLIKKMPKISFVFTDAFLPMPADDKFRDTEKLIEEIKSFNNVYLVPRTQSRRVIKEIIKSFDIGIIPYDVSLDFNRYCYPMKLFEYFYIGIPVISTPIEELKRFAEYVKIGNSSKEWENHINALLSKPWPKKYVAKQRKLAKNNSWENKIEPIIKLIQ